MEGNADDLADYDQIKEALEAAQQQYLLLRESEDHYRDLIEHSRDLVCTHDLHGVILSINRAAIKISGYDASFFLGRNIRDFLAPEYRHEFDAYLAEIKREGKASGLMQVQTHSGERRIWEYYNTLRTEGVSSPIVRGMAHDVTKIKQAEREIRKLNRDLERRMSEMRTLLEVIPIGIGIADDPECATIRVNPYFAKALGIKPDENASLSAPQGERPTNFKVFLNGRELHPDELPLQTAAKKGVVVSDFEVDVVHDDGRVVRMLECAAPLFNERGEVRGCVGAFLDITDRKRVEEERERLLARELAARAEAEAANRAKDDFLAIVSHELRTPLTALLGWSEILRSGNVSQADLIRGLDVIARNAIAQRQIIEDILDISRITSGKLHLNIAPTSLATVINAAVDVARPAADARAIEIRTTLDTRIGPVSGDGDRLQQVVWNLLSNAVKFTPDRGQIEVKLEKSDSFAQITVSDTGEGIDQEFLPYVFDRFRQADSSITRQHGGLGIGLAIVRHIVGIHGGAVEVYSAGKGRGARFTVKLPLDTAQAPQMAQAGELDDLASREHPKPEGLRVLVVDDDAETLEVIDVMLRQHGIEVLTSASAGDAIEIIRSLRPDVLISDIAMPDEDGYTLIKKVRALDPRKGGRIPAVALTAHVRDEDRTRALSSGYEIFIPKPVEASRLLEAIFLLAEKPGK
jgi:PAS domain S-box-containing protein